MDLAVLKKKAINEGLYPDASKFRDIESAALKFLEMLSKAEVKWPERYDNGLRL
jgi:hypothetical protein